MILESLSKAAETRAQWDSGKNGAWNGLTMSHLPFLAQTPCLNESRIVPELLCNEVVHDFPLIPSTKTFFKAFEAALQGDPRTKWLVNDVARPAKETEMLLSR